MCSIEKISFIKNIDVVINLLKENDMYHSTHVSVSFFMISTLNYF